MANREIRWVELQSGKPLRIVADGAIAKRGDCGGRLVPMVIVDTSGRPEIEELIRIHHAISGIGDVKFKWGRLEKSEEKVILVLDFVRPTEASVAIEFDIVRQGILVDYALSTKALYIQAGREGDRVKDNLSLTSILIEFVETGFSKIWEGLFTAQLEKRFRVGGMDRKRAQAAALMMIDESRKLSALRMPDTPPA